MLGAIAGDIIGSAYEWNRTKRTDFALFQPSTTFTDDTVMTCAVADALMTRRPYGPVLHEYGRRFPGRGYGGMFREWLRSDRPAPYGSFGNGSGMRASPVGFAARTLEDAMSEAERSASPTHDHPEGIKGAQAVASVVFLARQGEDKKRIARFVEERFGYDLRRTIEEIRPRYEFDVTCQGSVPESIVAFLESHDLESAIRLAVSLGGDADTQACMAGGMAQAFYGKMPEAIHARVREILDPELWALVERFNARFCVELVVQ